MSPIRLLPRSRAPSVLRRLARPRSTIPDPSSVLHPEPPALDRRDPITWVSPMPPRPIRRSDGEDPSGFFPAVHKFNLPDVTRPAPTSLLAVAGRPAQTTAEAGTKRFAMTQFFGALELDMDRGASGLERLLSVATMQRPPTPWRKPRSGRTVHVTDGLGSAMALFNRMVAIEKLPRIVFQQMHHERRGLKKKRLRSERYIARFKHSFVATLQRVQRMSRQGW